MPLLAALISISVISMCSILLAILKTFIRRVGSGWLGYSRFLRMVVVKFALFGLACVFLLKMPLFTEEGAYAQLSSLQYQIPTSSKGIYVMMEVVHAMKNLELSPEKNSLIVKEPGIYYMFASGQTGSLHQNAIGYFDLWFTKNGNDIPDSTARESLDRALAAGVVISQFTAYLEAGDRIAVKFSTSRPLLGFVNIYPENEPVIPSFLFSIFKIREFK